MTISAEVIICDASYQVTGGWEYDEWCDVKISDWPNRYDENDFIDANWNVINKALNDERGF